MKKPLLVLLILTISYSAIAMSKAPEPKKTISLKIDKTVAKQGEFFQVLVQNAKKKPKTWFNTREFEMFEVRDPDAWLPVDPKARKKSAKYKAYRALIPVENMTKTGSYSILTREGSWEEKVLVKVIDNGKGVSHITLSDDKSGLSATSKELNTIGSGLRARSKDKLWSGKFKYPTGAAKSSPFGVKRSYNGGPISSYHKGLDFAASNGDTVLAPADGKVIVAGREAEGFVVHGNVVMLDHGHALTSIYMHLSKIDVKKGDKVSKGDKIGEVGHTGISTGPHLHWGTYLYGTSVEPELFVSKDVL